MGSKKQRTIAPCEVTALDHEVLDDTVESRPLVTKVLLASCESTEVLSGLRSGLAVKTDRNAAKRFISVCDVEVHLSLGKRASHWGVSGILTKLVIFGPFTAEAVWAKKRKTAVRIKSREIIPRLKDAIVNALSCWNVGKRTSEKGVYS